MVQIPPPPRKEGDLIGFDQVPFFMPRRLAEDVLEVSDLPTSQAPPLRGYEDMNTS